jgi:hypothetical protein
MEIKQEETQLVITPPSSCVMNALNLRGQRAEPVSLMEVGQDHSQAVTV